MKIKRIILFLLIILVGIFLRFYQLGSLPDSLNWDEVSYGYNAYSVLNSGKDEYGIAYPAIFRAFGEYKQPVYMYLDVASVAVFGLNAFAVRFPSALFGSLSMVFVYLFVKELFRKKDFSKKLAILSMLLFAVSPWSIQFSRAAFEANVALFFIIAGSYIFIKGLHKKKPILLFLATLLLSVSLYTYLSAKLFVPLFFVALVVYGYKYFKENKKIFALIVGFFILCNSFWLMDSRTTARGTGVLFTSNQSVILANSIKKLEIDRSQNDKIGEIVHNRRIVYAQQFITNYLSHFSPEFLFLKGDSVSRHHPPNMGQLYLFSLPFIILGVFFLFSLQYITGAMLLLIWLFIAPLASSLTYEAPHALRSLVFLPIWHIFEAAGLLVFINLVSSIKYNVLRILVFIHICVFFMINFTYYIHQYFTHTNADFQKDWQYGYKEAIDYTMKYKDANKRVVFANSFEQPYIFYLFYNNYDPNMYISSGGSNRIDKKCFEIDNVYFGECMDKLRNGDIYVGTEKDDISNVKILKEFKYNNGEIASKIYQYK